MTNEMIQTSNDAFTFSTLGEATPLAKVQVLNAKNSAQPLNDTVDVPLHVVDCIMTAGKRSARSNNPEQPCINTYLICDDGVAYYSQSDGVASSMRDIVTAFPDLNKPHGLTLTCKSRVLPNGNSLKTIMVDLPN